MSDNNIELYLEKVKEMVKSRAASLGITQAEARISLGKAWMKSRDEAEKKGDSKHANHLTNLLKRLD